MMSVDGSEATSQKSWRSIIAISIESGSWRIRSESAMNVDETRWLEFFGSKYPSKFQDCSQNSPPVDKLARLIG